MYRFTAQRLTSVKQNAYRQLHRGFSTPAALSPIMQDDARYIVGTYARQPFTFVRGSGSLLYDSAGKEYIDFYSGIAVNSLGHSHPAWVNAITQQSTQLCHVSNLFYSEPQVALAKRLVESASFDKAFFCNSGTEANEAAIKFARKYAFVHTNKANPSAQKTDIVAFNGGFHGRTIGALSVTYKKAYKEPFYPLMDGVTFVDYNDTVAFERAVTDKTCAVIVEPIQGEGGVNIGEREFIQAIRRRCDEVGALMICDEVQAGLGRVGKLYSHQHFDVEPDIISLAKPLAGGLPIGALLVKQRVADVMKPGDHGTTFAGGALICSAAIATFDILSNPQFLQSVRDKSALLVKRLQQLSQYLLTLSTAKKIYITDIRSIGYNYHNNTGEGNGLLVGLELSIPIKNIITRCAERGVVCISAGDNILRLVPPLVITEAQINTAIDIIQDVISTEKVI